MEDTLKHKILIINDDQSGDLLKKAQNVGFKNVYEAVSQNAVELVRKHNIDIIFLVSSAANVTDLNLLQNINQLYLDIPIVMIADEMDPPLIREAIQIGACDFFIRPFGAKDIPIVVSRNVERKRLARQQLQKKQSDVLFKAIKSLIAAMEAKDRYTSGHSLRVVKYAMLMGRRLNFSDDDKFILQLSAALHDIGKIGVPDHILKSAKSLKDVEYRLVKEHPVTGSKIVGRIDELKEVAANIKHHHERYDGSGYPDGLKGDVIPLISRILSIVDAYESLVSDRIYRKGKTSIEAIEELRENSGTQFDPRLLELFIEEVSPDLSPSKMKSSSRDLEISEVLSGS